MGEEVQPPRPRRTDRVYVSSFITERLILTDTATGKLVTLEGLGVGHWATSGPYVEITLAQLYVMATWLDAEPGSYTFRVDLVLESDPQARHPISTTHKTVKHGRQSESWSIDLSGSTVPVGFNYLRISVDWVTKCVVPIDVYLEGQAESDGAP